MYHIWIKERKDNFDFSGLKLILGHIKLKFIPQKN